LLLSRITNNLRGVRIVRRLLRTSANRGTEINPKQFVSRRILSFVLSACLLTSARAAAAPLWFDQNLANAGIQLIWQTSGMPSISAAVMRIDDLQAGTAVAGVRRLSDPTAATAADRYHIGSNTKAITSTVIGRLVDQGILSWDSTVNQVLGPVIPHLDGSYRDVTLSELLTMRGGPPGLLTFDELAPYSSFPGTPLEQRKIIASTILSQPRVYAPGETQYSNASYAIAAAMAERASGQSWESMANDPLQNRLGIPTEIGWPGQDGTDQPWGHIVDNGTLLQIDPLGPQQFPLAFSPAGNLSMSMTDLARFGRQHLLTLSGQDNSLGLSSAVVERIHDQQGLILAMGWTDLSQFGGFGDTASAHQTSFPIRTSARKSAFQPAICILSRMLSFCTF
jgi:D-alanyl-D-alanine carboxypeptidase